MKSNEASFDGFGARLLTAKFIKEKHNISCTDGANVNGYTEPEIKDRLMHMIEDGIIWENNK